MDVDDEASSRDRANVLESSTLYWCHVDAAMVAVAACDDDSGELECVRCGSRFVEACEEAPDAAEDHPSTFVAHEVPMTASVRARTRARSRALSAGSDGGSAAGALAPSVEAAPPAVPGPGVRVVRMPTNGAGMQGMLQQLLAGMITGQAGGGLQLGGALGAGMGLPGTAGNTTTVGDYALGNMSELIAQLMQNDPNRPRAAPASASAVSGLEKVVMTSEMVACDDGLECAVCKDTFCVAHTVICLPCTHRFHEDCITPWLKTHNTCPVCRHALPTEEAGSAGGAAGGAGGSGGGGGGGGGGGAASAPPGTAT